MRPTKRFIRPADEPKSETPAPRRVFQKGRYSNTSPLTVDSNPPPPPSDPEGEQHIIDHGTPAASFGEGFSKYDGRSLGGHVVVPERSAEDENPEDEESGAVMLASDEPVAGPAPEAMVVDLTVRLGTWGTERRYDSDRYWRKDSRRL